MAKRVRTDSLAAGNAVPEVAPSRETNADTAAHTPKYTELESEADSQPAMECALPPHQLLHFRTYQDYETHYTQAHTNRCRECRRNFPTSHFLDLHLVENHDPIAATRRDKGEKTLACFVEGCDKLCGEWKKRRSHLVDKHGFPRNYDFFVVNNGIDGRRSMLRPGVDAHGHRRSSRDRRGSSATEMTQTTEATSVSSPAQDVIVAVEDRPASESVAKSGIMATDGTQDASVADITKSMSSLRFVPSSITFGKRKARAGFAKS